MSSDPPPAVDISYSVHGKGDPLLWAGDFNEVDPDLVRERFPLTTNGRSLITFTYRDAVDGNGNSREQSTRAYAADVLRLLDRLGIQTAPLVGTGGMGAVTMMEVGIAAPERVTAAALYQGWLKLGLRTKWFAEASQSLRRDTGYEAYQKLVLAMSHTHEYLEAHGERLIHEEWTDLDGAEMEQRHYGYLNAVLNHDASDRIDRMTSPTLLIAGDQSDLLTGDWVARRLHDAMSNSEMVIVQGAPHAIWESSDFLHAFDSAMAEFFTRHAVDRSGVR